MPFITPYHNADVAAIVTAMTDGEASFLFETVRAVLRDSCIAQVVLCIETHNNWVNSVLSALLEDPRVEILRLPIAPLGAIRNQALRQVRQPWVAYCDGDDVWCANKTQIQRDYAEAKGSDFVGADHYLTDKVGDIQAIALAQYIPMPSSWLVRSQVMRQHRFDESLAQGSDGEWWVRTTGLIQRHRYPHLLLKYRVRFGSLSSSTASKQRKSQIVALTKWPIVGELVLLASFCLWFWNRQETYTWLKSWETQYAACLPKGSPC
jgi:hypothetical protein